MHDFARMRAAITVMSYLLLTHASAAQAQETPGTSVPGEPTVIIDTPPAPPQPPVESDTQQQPGKVLVRAKPVRLRFQTQTDGVSFHLKRGALRSQTLGTSVGFAVDHGPGGVRYGPGYGIYSGVTTTKGFDLICIAPCEATMASGIYEMALSLHGAKPVESDLFVPVAADSIVDGRYVDRSRMRKAGWWVFGSAFIAGVVMMLAGSTLDAEGNPEGIRNRALFGTGIALIGASVVVGVPLIVQKDKAYINVYPLE